MRREIDEKLRRMGGTGSIQIEMRQQAQGSGGAFAFSLAGSAAFLAMRVKILLHVVQFF